MSQNEPQYNLTNKQKLFADYYVGEARQNATKAARLAGYSEKTARQMGSENLSKPDISAYIRDRLSELTLSAETVLVRLTEIANGDIDDFLNENGQFDLKKARRERKTVLIKKLKQKRTIKQTKTEVNNSMRSFLADDEVEEIESETEIIFEETEFELYSSHEALKDLGKYHKLFIDRSEIDIKGHLDISIDKAIDSIYDDESDDS